MWSGALTVLGLGLAIWVLVRIFSANTPWFGTAVILAGVVGIFLTVSAFFVIQNVRLSRVLLGLATVVLFLVMILTAVVP